MMKKLSLIMVFSMACILICPAVPFAGSSDKDSVQGSLSDTKGADSQASSTELADETEDPSDSYGPDEYDEYDDYVEDYDAAAIISDPLEPVNRAFFVFNDKLYFWVLRPVAKGYRAIAPEPVRVGVKNFFANIGFPIRFVNCLLQGKLSGAGNEFERFFINSTLGLAGFIDMAEKEFGVKAVDEDFGQTLGAYGLGQGFYINWPILGPSSALETVGLGGDYFLDPVFYLDLKFKYSAALKGYKIVNSTSLSIGDYETVKNSALDPYVAFRDAYIQYRRNKIKE